MTSFRLSISPHRRAAGRFVAQVRRSIQKALAEESKISGITQSQIARAIGVHRSVINREIRGHKDLTLGRVAELAWALGREPVFDLVKPQTDRVANEPPPPFGAVEVSASTSPTAGTAMLDEPPISARISAA